MLRDMRWVACRLPLPPEFPIVSPYAACSLWPSAQGARFEIVQGVYRWTIMDRKFDIVCGVVSETGESIPFVM